jgi:hypothetical protein
VCQSVSVIVLVRSCELHDPQPLLATDLPLEFAVAFHSAVAIILSLLISKGSAQDERTIIWNKWHIAPALLMYIIRETS